MPEYSAGIFFVVTLVYRRTDLAESALNDHRQNDHQRFVLVLLMLARWNTVAVPPARALLQQHNHNLQGAMILPNHFNAALLLVCCAPFKKLELAFRNQLAQTNGVLFRRPRSGSENRIVVANRAIDGDLLMVRWHYSRGSGK